MNTILRKVIYPSLKENYMQNKWYSTKGRPPKSNVRITLISASVGVLVGAGYGGYTHYKVNSKRSLTSGENYLFLEKAPEYKAHYKAVNAADTSKLQLVLFQLTTCPFCCKVRAFLDHNGINYEVVEVDAVLKQAIKWSGYKKVPILLAKVEGGYQQLMDSTAIISILSTYLKDNNEEISNILKYYPPNRFVNDSGKEVTDIPNKYFVMHNASIADKQNDIEMEERKWRKWADNVLVHLLSPNVYRTPGEALETFKWFEEVGEWQQKFPAWECAVMTYGGAFAMWLISKRLKKRHNLQDNVRIPLYKAVNDWMRELSKKGTTFMGGDQPNLADLSVYGVLTSIEGCQAFKDLRDHTKIDNWFDAMKNVTAKNEKVYLQ